MTSLVFMTRAHEDLPSITLGTALAKASASLFHTNLEKPPKSRALPAHIRLDNECNNLIKASFQTLLRTDFEKSQPVFQWISL